VARRAAPHGALVARHEGVRGRVARVVGPVVDAGRGAEAARVQREERDALRPGGAPRDVGEEGGLVRVVERHELGDRVLHCPLHCRLSFW
jgi:hypothetical protein